MVRLGGRGLWARPGPEALSDRAGALRLATSQSAETGCNIGRMERLTGVVVGLALLIAMAAGVGLLGSSEDGPVGQNPPPPETFFAVLGLDTKIVEGIEALAVPCRAAAVSSPAHIPVGGAVWDAARGGPRRQPVADQPMAESVVRAVPGSSFCRTWPAPAGITPL